MKKTDKTDNESMSARSLPNDNFPAVMLKWIASKYRMSRAGLSRMFQVAPSTISYWMKNGDISYKNFRKIRASYYYLHNTTEPYINERRCLHCRKWLPDSDFRGSKAICRRCENHI